MRDIKSFSSVNSKEQGRISINVTYFIVILPKVILVILVTLCSILPPSTLPFSPRKRHSVIQNNHVLIHASLFAKSSKLLNLDR